MNCAYLQLLSGSMRMIWNYVLLRLLVMHCKYADATNLVLWLKSISNCKFYGRNKRHTSRMKCSHFIWMNKVNKQLKTKLIFLCHHELILKIQNVSSVDAVWILNEHFSIFDCFERQIYRGSKQYSNSVFNIQRGNRWQITWMNCQHNVENNLTINHQNEKHHLLSIQHIYYHHQHWFRSNLLPSSFSFRVFCLLFNENKLICMHEII